MNVQSSEGKALLDLAMVAAVDLLVGWLEKDTHRDELLSRYPFLAGYLRDIEQLGSEPEDGPRGLAAWSARLARWQAERWKDDHPLWRLRAAYGLDLAELMGLLLAALPDEDSRFGALLADVQGSPELRYPTAETIGRVQAAASPRGRVADLMSVSVALIRHGLLAPVTGGPRGDRALHVPELLWDALTGRLGEAPAPGIRFTDRADCPRVDDLIYSAAFLAEVEAVPRALETAGVSGLLIRHDPGADVTGLAGAIARLLGGALVHVGKDVALDALPQGLGATVSALGAILMFERELGPGDVMPLPRVPGHAGAVVVSLGREGGLTPLEDQATVTLDVPFPGKTERSRAWRRALRGHRVKDLEGLGARFQVPLGFVGSIARGAIAEAALHGREHIEARDVLAASRQLNRQQLDALADPLETYGDWSWLVARPLTVSQLHELELRCRVRESLPASVGETLSATVGRGVRALFTGPSGTGKTLAARILARTLGYDIYRVDLGAIVNKYVGETEKNLHRVLTRAESLDVILLLDEGDALLGQRTEVSSANDRYANLETNYLLQRLEAYQGIVLVTTNLGENIDRAFQRRMDLVVSFFRPRETERSRIWADHLPEDHQLSDAFYRRVVEHSALTGGQIRNVVSQAAAIALERCSAIDDSALRLALMREHQKAGLIFTPDTGPELPAYDDGGFADFATYMGRTARRL